LVQDFAGEAVHGVDVVVVLGPVVADLGGVGVVGGDADLGRVLAELMGAGADLAFVGDGEVEDGEEGLAGLAFAPVGLVARFVPDDAGVVDVVILFRVVGGVVAGGYRPEMMVVRAGAQTGALDQQQV
jgi:hypothetical protein